VKRIDVYLLHSQYWENSEICFHNNFYFHSVLGTELPLYDLAFKKCIKQGGEMNQALYAHMNNKRKMKKKIKNVLILLLWSMV
jgi:hypothetical protein